MGLVKKVLNTIKRHAIDTVVDPISTMVDTNLTDITTTIGSFIIRSVRGKFQRSITFTIGSEYADMWMEEALYGILYEYNQIKLSSNLELSNKKGFNDGSALYYKLGDGTHNLKYRKWNILLCIQSKISPVTINRKVTERTYTVITFDLDPKFVTYFEQDLVARRNSLLRIKKDSPTLTIYRDYHESDGYTMWEKAAVIPKRKLSTIYLPEEQKRLLVSTINNFFASKKFYNEHGIPHNLKILLHGGAGSGKAQPISTPIPTPDGWKKMGDLKVGDKVFAENGSITEILGVFPQGIKDVYRITLEDGRTIECELNHLWKAVISQEGFNDIMDIFDTQSIINMVRRGCNICIPAYDWEEGMYNVSPIRIRMDEVKWIKIDHIDEKVRQEECRCIYVAHETHMYITDKFIITHNTSITKMIASEWNRNLFECTGGKNGKFIPNAIVANGDTVTCPLMSISDIDKYPQLVNEPDVNLDDKENKEEKLDMKQTFNNMINALDGITSPEDRIIVMTTNHIEKISDVFLRPGRVDLIMEIGYVQVDVFRKYVFDMYGVELPGDIKLKDDKLTIGKMQFDVVFGKLTADEFIQKYVE